MHYMSEQIALDTLYVRIQQIALEFNVLHALDTIYVRTDCSI